MVYFRHTPVIPFLCPTLPHSSMDSVLVLYSFTSNFYKTVNQTPFYLSLEVGKDSPVDRPRLVSPLLVYAGYPRNISSSASAYIFLRTVPGHGSILSLIPQEKGLHELWQGKQTCCPQSGTSSLLELLWIRGCY